MYSQIPPSLHVLKVTKERASAFSSSMSHHLREPGGQAAGLPPPRSTSVAGVAWRRGWVGPPSVYYYSGTSSSSSSRSEECRSRSLRMSEMFSAAGPVRSISSSSISATDTERVPFLSSGLEDGCGHGEPGATEVSVPESAAAPPGTVLTLGLLHACEAHLACSLVEVWVASRKLARGGRSWTPELVEPSMAFWS